jgi:hypothetical protein
MALEDEDRDQVRGAEPGNGGGEAGAPEEAATDLRAECERLREEVRRLEQERDTYYRHLCHLLGDYFDVVHGKLTDEKMTDMIANAKWVPFEEIIKELEQIGKEK